MVILLPKRLIKATIKLFLLSESERTALLKALKEVPSSLSLKKYEKHLKETFDYDAASVRDYVRFFISTYNLNERKESHSEIAKGVIEGLKELDIEDIQEASQEDFDNFYHFLLGILESHETVGLSAKGLQVVTQHDKILAFCEIHTDIRNIFSRDTSKEVPVAAAIVHTLKLHTHGSHDYEDLYVAMDYDSLIELKSVIERAEKKHESSKKVIAKADLIYLVTEGEDNGY